MTCFKLKHFILTLLLSKIVLTYNYVDENGVEIDYKVKFQRECRGKKDILVYLHNIPLPKCVMACGLRPSCKAVSYVKRYNKCNIYSSDGNESDRVKGSCIEIRASDIQFKEKPCQNCERNQTCNAAAKECENTECLNDNVMMNGIVIGNMKEVGSQVQYKCNNEDFQLECLKGGVWNITNDICKGKEENVALGKETNMSSISSNHDYRGHLAVDGDINQKFDHGSCFHTANENRPWWRVDLGRIYHVFRVVLYNRLDCCSAQASDLDLMMGSTVDNIVTVRHVDGQIDDVHTFNFPAGEDEVAQFVQVLLRGQNAFHLCEVQVFGF